MRLLLFKKAFEPNQFSKFNWWIKAFLKLNLTFIGGLSFIGFDFIGKFTALCLFFSMVTFPFAGSYFPDKIFYTQEYVLLKVFNIDSQDLKAFEAQKKIAVPMFEDLPMLIIQMIVFHVSSYYNHSDFA